MITSVRSETGLGSARRYTERRKPSAAARVSSLSSISVCMPVRTGRESSVAAAKTTWLIAVRRLLGSSSRPAPPSTRGIGGKSSASMPPIVASLRAQTSRI